MKKIKKISVRLSQEDYRNLFWHYMWYKDNPMLAIFYFKQEIKTFSDYIRLMINKGFND